MSVTISFGPVPSRRLGQSLGINNIPPKHCSYSCVYCQVGPTLHPITEPREFFTPQQVADDVAHRVEKLREKADAIDYLTFVPDGEPTLDAQLAEEIARLRPLGIPIAVITNGSLLWRPEVRKTLEAADWVSVKVDAAIESTWRAINQPATELDFETVKAGVLAFARSFRGTLATETMLVAGINDSESELRATAEFLATVDPAIAYVAIPTRPAARENCKPAPRASVELARTLIAPKVRRVELLVSDPEGEFATTGEIAEELLRITAVHPMKQHEVRAVLDARGLDWGVVDGLIESGQLVSMTFGGERFYRAAGPDGS